MSATCLKTHKSFGGATRFWEHESAATKTKMKFSTYTPSGEIRGAVIWLSGLTCTDENFITKAGAQRRLEERGLMVVCPDTSPRGLNLPGEHDAYDFGSGASFYVDATTEGYRDHYRMFTYVAQELPALVRSQFGVAKLSIMGHSMGGHGALVIALRNPDVFRSVSAFAPIANPRACPWGRKALPGYLGPDAAPQARYDATELVKAGARFPGEILIDQGLQDEFYEKKQLLPENFEAACRAGDQPVRVNYREGYDHSYYFIATFIDAHIDHHAAALG